jgi:hypothetical protein
MFVHVWYVWLVDYIFFSMIANIVTFKQRLRIHIYSLWNSLHVQWGDTEIGTLCNSRDSAHIAANFDTLPSAGKLLFIHEILDLKSLLCPQHVYQILKLEDLFKKRYWRFTSEG